MSIFLSYNSKDRGFVKKVNTYLNSKGHTTYFDQANIEPGDIWTKNIQNGIDKSSISLVFIGEYGVGSWQEPEILSLLDKKSDTNSYKVI